MNRRAFILAGAAMPLALVLPVKAAPRMVSVEIRVARGAICTVSGLVINPLFPPPRASIAPSLEFEMGKNIKRIENDARRES